MESLAAQVSSALEDGDLIVLRCGGGVDINDARVASRRASAWLLSVSALPNLRVSRSATAGLGVVAVHRECALGVDVERANTERVFDGIAHTLLHPDEFDALFSEPLAHDALAHVWVRKEATLKAFGVGLAVSPTAIITGPYSEQWRTVTHAILGTALVQSIKAPDGFAVGVALLGAHSASIKGFVFDETIIA